MKNPVIGLTEFDSIILETVYPAIVKAFGSIARENAPETDALVIAAAEHLKSSLNDLCDVCGETFLRMKNKEYDPDNYENIRTYARSLLSTIESRGQ